MAAGLAHELNNPAAALSARRADMADALDVIGATLGEFVEAGVERDRRRRGSSRCSARRSRGAEERTALDALDAADAEDAMLERLEDLGVPEPWRLAEPLAAAGVDEAWLPRVARSPGPRPAPRCAGWPRR